MPEEASDLACFIYVRALVPQRLWHVLTDAIDALNRYPDLQNEEQTVQILRYIFPRQFGLHNVFTSHVEPRECALPFMDYTLREKDMHNSMRQALGKNSNNRQEASKWRSRTPKRLRGAATAWANKLRILHRRCSYLEMLRHYCPVEVLPRTMAV